MLFFFFFFVKFKCVPKAYETLAYYCKLRTTTSLNYITVSGLTAPSCSRPQTFLMVIFSYHFVDIASIKLHYTIWTY